MENLYKPHSRSYYPYSLLSLSCLITFIIFLQGPILVVAQPNQYESVIASNNKIRTGSTTSTLLNHDDTGSDAESDIYDDDNNEDFEEISPSTTSLTQIKVTPNITSHFPAHAEEVLKTDYEDESDSYQHEFNDDETTNQDESQKFGDTIPAKPINRKPELSNSNNKKLPDFSSTPRLPFLSANLWRDLFTKPGILVGIIGGVVIGMLSAILLVMFIIYRMRKKDEGSYALEEGPRKSPSHAYTRVSSREFFA